MSIQVTGWSAMLLAMAIAAALTYLIGFPIRSAGLRMNIMDRPIHRSSHTEAVPRVGGVAIILGAFGAGLTLFKPTPAFAVGAGIGAMIAIISFLDDFRQMPSPVRFAVHLAVTLGTVLLIRLIPDELNLPYLPLPLSPALGVFLAVLFVVAFVNFFNFMDGINGIAAAQGIWGAGTMSLLLFWGGTANSVLAAAAVAGACLGFLPHNFPKARMFMGDVGSATLGFVLAMLTLLGAKQTKFPWIVFLMPLGVFIYDAAFTVIKRMIRGQKFYKAHREHHYQLLIRSGWSHTAVTCLQITMMTCWSAGALLYNHWGNAGRLALLTGLLGMMIVYSVLVHRTFRRHGAPADPAAQTGAGI
ncbi:MAG: glycosyltransferase family 4 protein [Planctomycetaceae bacterium]|nr:glycosyltransferase family 4 protein [Planctomycetaceae bacterium]